VNPLPVVPIPSRSPVGVVPLPCVLFLQQCHSSVSDSLANHASSKSPVSIGDVLAVLPGVPPIVLVSPPREELIREHVTREWQD
jgi:hypothetical protein